MQVSYPSCRWLVRWQDSIVNDNDDTGSHDNNDIDDNDIVDNLNSSMIDELENCSHIRLVEKGSDYK